MKRFAIVAVMLMLGLGAGARSIHYFTYSQAARTVDHLNKQNELMIYCGYDYEIETYVLISDIWMERVNSSYYEIWVYGFDAYTGEEIYMPLDLQCVWLYSAGRMYNAAQYLRFRVSAHVPSIVWRVPPYNPYTRVAHRTGYVRTYHYDVHRHGWMPQAHGFNHSVHPYYMRQPRTTPPMPENKWTPGVDRPTVSVADRTHDNNPATGTKATNTTRSTSSANTAAPSTSRANGTSRSTSTTPSRSTSATSTTPTKATSTSRSTSATPSTSAGESSTSRSTSATSSTPASTSRSTSTTSPSPTKASNTTRFTSVTPSAPSSSRSVSASPTSPTKATNTTRSVSASPSTPTKATNTTRSTSASPSTSVKATKSTRSTSIKRP